MTIRTDALIIGAGPVGLFQVFELGLLGVGAHVVDALPQVGGQCSELYPDKPIYDIPALPTVRAQELVERLMQQIKPFNPAFHLAQEVTHLVNRVDGRFYLATTKGTEFLAKTVIIAAGVGAFQPRRLDVEGIEELEGIAVHYKVTDPRLFAGKSIVILGGGDSALDWALELHAITSQVTLIHRSQQFRATPASIAKLVELRETGKIHFLEGNVVGLKQQQDRLVEVQVKGSDTVTRDIELDHLLIFFGLSPKLGPIANWGLDRVKNQIVVDTEKFESSVSGVFAIGDINVYPGKKKLILSGFHEAALASFAVRQHLFPQSKVLLQYTTTSPKLHERLGLRKAV